MEGEDERICEENVIRTDDYPSIQNIVSYYGYKVECITNYEDAIQKLTENDSNRKCKYNSLWIMSGYEGEELPHGGNKFLVDQFIEYAIKFWENGGSIFLMAENEHYTFQANLFLDKLIFPKTNEKVKFRLEESNKGGNLMIPNKEGILEKGQFNNKINLIHGLERISISANLNSIYEGITVAHTNTNNLGDLKPFIPFSCDNDRGINSLFYCSSHDGKEGDIVIDCSYTKFFLDLDKNTTSKYLLNISAFISNCEKHYCIDGTDVKYRPDSVKFTGIDYNKKYKFSFDVDIVYLVDATGSMKKALDMAKNYCEKISEECKKKYNSYNFEFGGIFYRDPVEEENDKNEFFNLNKDIKQFKSFVIQ